MNILGLWILILSSTAITAYTPCDVTSVNNCLYNVVRYVKKNGAMVKVKDEKEMHQMCRVWDTASSCLAEFEGNCEEEAAMMVEVIRNELDYICHDGFKGFMKHHICLDASMKDAEVQTCNRTLQSHMNQIKRDAPTEDRSTALSELCRTMDTWVSCTRKAVKRVCGEDASKFMRTLLINTLRVAYNKAGCNALPTWLVLTLVAVGVFIGASLLTGFIHWYRKRRAATQNRPTRLREDC